MSFLVVESKFIDPHISSLVVVHHIVNLIDVVDKSNPQFLLGKSAISPPWLSDEISFMVSSSSVLVLDNDMNV